MYIPEFFKCKDPLEVREFINANSFGILVSHGDNALMATHIPFLLHKNNNGDDVLLGHVSRANPQLGKVKAPLNVLAIFQGPHAYVSSSWYDHENVPTWNYIAAHVYGSLKIIEGDALVEALGRMVDKYEKFSASPVSLKTISQDYLHQHLKGVIGFEIGIERIEAAKKLSQNRDDVNFHRIVDALEKRTDAGSRQIAGHMKPLRPDAS